MLYVLRSSQSSHPNWEVTSVPLNLEEPSSIVQLLLLWPSSQILSFLICNVLIKSMKESNSAWHKSSSSRYITVIWFVGMCVCQHACVRAHMNVCSCGSQKASSGIVPQILCTRVFCFVLFFLHSVSHRSWNYQSDWPVIPSTHASFSSSRVLGLQASTATPGILHESSVDQIQVFVFSR